MDQQGGQIEIVCLLQQQPRPLKEWETRCMERMEDLHNMTVSGGREKEEGGTSGGDGGEERFGQEVTIHLLYGFCFVFFRMFRGFLGTKMG